MKAYLAPVLAILGIAMFSGSIWVQRSWLPQVKTSQPEPEVQAVSSESAQPEPETLAGSEAGEEWAVDHVTIK